MEEEEDHDLLVEEREAEMVPLTGSKQPIKRKAWFLTPIESVERPLPPSLPKPATFLSDEASHISFAGWRTPQRRWRQWVDKLRPVYEHLWEKVGILGAIQASTFATSRDPSSIFGVAAFWNEDTNTFHFPWLEATITLEDVMVLGEFSVLGEAVRVVEALSGELGELEAKMVAEIRRLNRSAMKKAAQCGLMKQFMEGEGDEAEHIAFLSLWLSRFVFPSYPGGVIRLGVLPVAVRLARGARIALAPAVLASLYRDLRLLRYHLAGNGGCSSSPLVLWAPFQILQLWVWERFVALRPKEQNCIEGDQPRAARWHEVRVKNQPSYVRSVLGSFEQFLWRPYSIRIDDWRTPGFYKETGEWVCGDIARNEALRSFLCCLRHSELVGMDCIEQYLPHRVAMQFGLDQDIPSSVPREDSTWEVAWKTYEMPAKDVRFYVSPRLSESDATLRYSIWWKKHMMAGADAADSDMRTPVSRLGRTLKTKNEMMKRKKICSFPKKKCRRVEEIHEPTISDWLAWSNRHASKRKKVVNSEKSSQNGETHNWIVKQKTDTGLKLSFKCVEKVGDSSDALGRTDTKESIEMGEVYLSDLETRDLGILKDVDVVDLKLSLECAGKVKDNSDALGQTDTKGSIEMGEDYLFDLATRDLGIKKDVDVADFISGSIVAVEADVTLTPQLAKLTLEEMQKNSRQAEKISKLDVKIKMLKEEIAAIQAKLIHLESVTEYHIMDAPIDNFIEDDITMEAGDAHNQKRECDDDQGATDGGASGEKRWPGWPGDSVFRILIPAHKVVSIIGKEGEYIKRMCEESKSRIKILDAPHGVPERAVIISAKEEPDALISPAMDGLLRVHRRIFVGLDGETHASNAGNKVPTRLLAATTQARTLIGKQGATIKSIQESSNCVVRILEDLPPVALPGDRVVEIVGEPSRMHKAVELIANQLRKFLVDRSVINLFEKSMLMQLPPMEPSMQPPQGHPPNAGGPGYGGNLQFMSSRPHYNFYPPNDYPPLENPRHQGISTYGRDAPHMGIHPSTNHPPATVSQIPHHMQIPLSYADAVIGAAGSNISYIRRTSGATVTIQETRGVPGEMTVEIIGSATQVHTAQQLIHNLMAGAAGPGQAPPQNPKASPGQGYDSYSGQGHMYGLPPRNAPIAHSGGGYGSSNEAHYGY